MIRTVLLFGGRSAEHEVSILSARSVANAAPKQRIEPIAICIAKDGRFIAPERSAKILDGSEKSGFGDEQFSFETWVRSTKPDIVFPLIHGTGGEDGTVQGYLETIGVPYVGAGVAASAIGMDKAHMKHAFAAMKLPMVEYVQVLETDWKNERDRIVRAINNALRLPYFVKPANSGSSVGVTKVKTDGDLGAAGYARVDFFLERGTSRVVVNEINTIPGFTNISMYPKLWEATEIKYSHLIEKLIDLGLHRWRAREARRDSAMKWFEEVKALT